MMKNSFFTSSSDGSACWNNLELYEAFGAVGVDQLQHIFRCE